MTSNDGDGRTWWNRHRPRLATAMIAGVEFPRVHLPGGLDPGAVYGHLEHWQARVDDESSVKDRERDHWHQKYRRLEKHYLSQGTAGAAMVALANADDASATAARMIAKAQDTIDDQVRQTREWCGRLTDQARERRDGIIADGKEEARQHAAQIIENARAQADKILDQAREYGEKAAAAARADPAPPAQTEAERTESRAESAYARAFSAGTRDGLRAMLMAVLHVLDDWERREADALRQAREASEAAALVPAITDREDQDDHDRQPA